MQKHTTDGYDIVKNDPSKSPYADTTRHHHEKLDGSGYPDGLKAKDITLYTRIISIIDIYEALEGKRPYHEHNEPWPHKKIKSLLIKEANENKLDKELIGKFIQCIEIEKGMAQLKNSSSLPYPESSKSIHPEFSHPQFRDDAVASQKKLPELAQYVSQRDNVMKSVKDIELRVQESIQQKREAKTELSNQQSIQKDSMDIER